MKLATFNLLHGMPVLGAERVASQDRADGVRPPVVGDQPLADAIAHLDADVLGIQEVDVGQSRSGSFDQPAVVAKAMGAQWSVFAPTVLGTPGEPGWQPSIDGTVLTAGLDGASESAGRSTLQQQQRASADSDARSMYGVGLVSRWPILDYTVTRFPASRGVLPLLVPGDPRPQIVRVADEPRAAIAAVIDTPMLGPITVVTAHLSFVPFVNVRQLRALVRSLADFPRPVVLLGDFNLPGRLPARVTRWKSLASGATYPTMRPTVQFDHVLADGLPADVRARATVHALAVSDHCALSVTLRRTAPRN